MWEYMGDKEGGIIRGLKETFPKKDDTSDGIMG